MADPSSSRTKQPVLLSTLLADMFRDRRWDSQRELHRVFLFWEQAVGPDISCQAQPQRIRNTTLWVQVRDPIWMQQLHLQKILLLERLNQRLTKARLTDIRFTINTNLKTMAPAPETRPRDLPLKKEIDPQKKQQGERLVAGLKNDEIRAALQSLWDTFHR
ncbi:MAG: DUF721 domain-containing protein [Desulfobacterales bacterium]|nr:DUF721 domain-containing protein [Desulfobacterales bacterium]